MTNVDGKFEIEAFDEQKSAMKTYTFNPKDVLRSSIGSRKPGKTASVICIARAAE